MDYSAQFPVAGTQAYWVPGPILSKEEAARANAVGGPGYVAIKLHSAQAVLPKSIWDFFRGSPQAVLTSSVQVHHPSLGRLSSHSIHEVRHVQRNRANQLGVSLLLVELIPATINRVRLSAQLLVSSSSHLQPLVQLTQNNDLATALSFAPGAVPVARLLGSLVDQLLTAFVDDSDKYMLDLTADLDIGAHPLQSGWWVVLASNGAPPLPDNPNLAIQGTRLTLDGKAVTDYSYAVFGLDILAVRGESAGEGQPWHDLLTRQREAVADISRQRPPASKPERQRLWERIEAELKEISILLRMDRQYTDREKLWIVSQAAQDAFSQLGLAADLPAPDRSAIVAESLAPSVMGAEAGAMTRGITDEATKLSPDSLATTLGLEPEEVAATFDSPLVRAADLFPAWIISAFNGSEPERGRYAILSAPPGSLRPGEAFALASGIRAYEKETEAVELALRSFQTPLYAESAVP